MAERHDIEAWINPAAWEDPAEAGRVIDAILESGAEDEATWARLAGAPELAVVEAAGRDYARANGQLDAAKGRLADAVHAAAQAGLREADLVVASGAARATVRKWMGKP